MGRITKGRKCSVKLCENDAIRSISLSQISNYLELKTEKRMPRAFLCKVHYKEYKKKSKKDKKTQKLRYGGGQRTSKRGGLKGPMS
ncbi:MAG: hypothetical protein HWN67_21615 [Candidatus Helarchaeota archaeon]|nr:hypothetical protein [Candidatus Helarchaeota archaeon]